MLSAIFAWLSLTTTLAWGHTSSLLQRQSTGTISHSMNVTNCPGYTLGSLAENEYGLTAQLSLAGTPCNAFGTDIMDLTIEVTYQSQTTLHVKIYDTANQQFTIPESVIESPPAPTESFTGSSDLVFNYDPSPFAFWITRRSDPEAMPIFDTRITSFPSTPIPPFNTSDPRTAFDGFPLVFEDQYLQVASALPYGTNIYGLGEVIASSGFRRDIGTDGGVGTIQTLWARDVGDPIDQNMYGSHPIYLEHRFNETTNTSSSSGVLLLSSAGSDIFLQTPANSKVSLIEYRMIGGILDFYFFSGPTDMEVIAQYGATIGFPMWQPAWGFGFHLCRWGYVNISEDIANVAAMRAANIPLEVQWNDIDLYHAFRGFTTDPVRFPGEELQQFIEQLTANHQHYIPIVDAGIGATVNTTDVYYPFSDGVTMDTFIENPDGSLYLGQVWPGYSAFPDWFAENTQAWWTEALTNWTELGVNFSGIWLDMNEASSFCSYSCGTGANFSALKPFSVIGAVATGYPECYNETLWGPSGNMTINGTSTNSCPPGTTETLKKRGIGAGGEPSVNLTSPPYAIHNGYGAVSTNTLATNATHYGGYVELDVHNMFGMMEEMTTHLALQTIFQGKRPFLISRSTFPSSGKWTGHWLGDNYSKWQYMYLSIQGVLQFQIYQIPMVGADTCGFNDNTDEELCNRWMQLAAFTPFYRNHNTYGALPQEPYRWDSVANASRIAIAARYSMLPYWYTLFANASTNGLPPVRALFYEFPTEPELFNVDRQWLIGSDILITPVLTPGATTVDGIFPGRGTVVWRDWWTHAVVDATPGGNTTLSAPISHINVHIRDSSILLLHQEPAYTIYETREGPYSLLVSLNKAGTALGNAYVDDGESYPPGANRILSFSASNGELDIESTGEYPIPQTVETVTILGVQQPTTVTLNGDTIEGWTYDGANEELIISNLSIELNAAESKLCWE
ncbi:glycoside hydrolase family 31 protein [Boletus edulis]|uniref:Glycoside hydrolase family 31 protein n=1 Tax=Boletus edulis BED1 TaxID=1328754 RepID=A0AAD4B9M7_BOLED|nr:glycoside hydrolase family 31 protein [Boletus edulis]KAF8414999.1 glycoside hydrolase family 31 protein [Boletus edulis BED1]